MDRWAPRGVCAVAAVHLLCGCAVSYVDDQGARHLVGWVHVSLPPATDGLPPAESLRARTVGLLVTSGDVGRALSVGYADITMAYVRGNTCVRWPLESALAGAARRDPP